MIRGHKETVAIVRSEGDVDAAVRCAISLAGGLSDVAGKRVVVKPNLMSPALSGSGQITDARVTIAVARIAQEAGARVTIAEGSAVGFWGTTEQNDTFEAADLSGLTAAAQTLGVPIVDLNREPNEAVVPPGGGYGMHAVPLARVLAEADLIISVPIIKAHPWTGLTVAVKNFQGVMPWRDKRLTHRAGLEAGLSDIYSVVRPGFAVVDGLVTHNAGGRIEPDVILAGRDCVAVDATCCRAVGFPPDRLGVLKFCAERGLGTIDADEIEVKGLSVGSLGELLGAPWPWAPMERPKMMYPQVEWITTDPFPSCAYTYGIQVALHYIKAVYGPGVLSGLRVALGEGPARSEKVKVDVVVGDAAAEWATGPVEMISRCPIPAVVVAELCRLRDLDPEPIIAFRKRVPGSDWSDIRTADQVP